MNRILNIMFDHINLLMLNLSFYWLEYFFAETIFSLKLSLILCRAFFNNNSFSLVDASVCSHQYEKIAIHLVNAVESDHLLALLLEIPTNIQQKTIIVQFINSERVQCFFFIIHFDFVLMQLYKNV